MKSGGRRRGILISIAYSNPYSTDIDSGVQPDIYLTFKEDFNHLKNKLIKTTAAVNNV